MKSGRGVLAGVGLALSTPAIADQPFGIAPATVCSLTGSVCATRGQATVTIWRKLPEGRRKRLWRVRTRGQTFAVADDGRSLVEIQPLANLVDANARSTTPIFTFYRPDGPPARVALGEMIRDVESLPRTMSHRHWARTLGYDGRGHFQVDTVEGRRILFDPRTGRRVLR